MSKNNGEEFEEIVYVVISSLIIQGEFFINSPCMSLYRKKGYFGKK